MKNDCELCSFNPEETVFCNAKWRVIQVNDSDYPGFCRVIWNEHVKEMTDLSGSDRNELMNAVFVVEKIVRDVMGADKVNLASFGNMVPHLHWHVIPRFENDKNFPDSIWSPTKCSVNPDVMKERMMRASTLKNALRHELEK